MMSPCRRTLQPYQNVTRSALVITSGPVLQLFVGQLELGKGAHSIEIVAVFLHLDLLRLPAPAERRHAREAHHHLRIDVLRASRHANATASADTDPPQRLGRAFLTAKDGEHTTNGAL